ncbi:DinB family protein [Brevibacillus brevis]|nr:DinB family protein [Brevibacillus brevis]GEC88764.1 hypothetical protein BBR01nite_10950 [Brevibacillus brevis]VEF86964.1 Uncharacterised protein [Brevibacillus brevis]
MNENDLLILNFEEVRRRSIKVWRAIPKEMLNWKPDDKAFTCGEMIRHVIEGEFLYHQIFDPTGECRSVYYPQSV